MSILFVLLMLVVFGGLLGLAVKLTWGVAKILLFIVFLPLVLIGLVAGGLIFIALPILIIIGVGALVFARA